MDEEKTWSNGGGGAGKGEEERGRSVGEGWAEGSQGLDPPQKPLCGPCLSQPRGPCAAQIASASS